MVLLVAFCTWFAFAGAVGSSQDGALVYAAEGLEQPSDVFVALLLSKHPHKQLPVLCKTREARSESTPITFQYKEYRSCVRGKG